MVEERDVEIAFLPTNTSKIHLHVEQLLQKLVLRLGVRPEPLRWESRVQDIGPLENSQPLIISIGKSSPEISLSTLRSSSTQQPASCSARHPIPNN